MSVTYKEIRDSAVEQIKERFSADRRIHIAPHPGTFDGEEIRRLATQTPAILTSLIRISDRDVQDESSCDFVSWILYRADNQDRLYDGALTIISSLIPVIRNLDAEWSIGGGTDIQAECLYSGSLDRINITLWAIRWRWQARGMSGGGAISLPEDLDYFEGYNATHEVGTQTINDEVHLEVSDAHTVQTNPE